MNYYKRAFYTALAGAGLVVVVAVAQQRGFGLPPSEEVFSSLSLQVTHPSGETSEDVTEAYVAYLNGASLPAGYAIADEKGIVRGFKTGIVNGSGQSQVVVTVVDDSADMQWATLYLSGASPITATRANGGIRDDGVKAAATFSFFLPASGSYSVEVEWVPTRGATLRQAVLVTE